MVYTRNLLFVPSLFQPVGSKQSAKAKRGSMRRVVASNETTAPTTRQLIVEGKKNYIYVGEICRKEKKKEK